MDPVLKSTLTSLVLWIAGLAAGWLFQHGVITQDQVANLTSSIVTVLSVAASAAVGLLVAWYKARQHTQTAQIQAVNAADNGVKVVAAAEAARKVESPLK